MKRDINGKAKTKGVEKHHAVSVLDELKTRSEDEKEKIIEEHWVKLRRAILQILTRNKSGLVLDDLIRSCYTMILCSHGDRLYTGLREELTHHLEGVRTTVTKAFNNNFLKTLNDAWMNHHASMVAIRDMLLHMDKCFGHKKNHHNVYDLGLILFAEKVVSTGRVDACGVRSHLLHTLLDMIKRERCGEVIDRIAVRNVCQMLMDLGLHTRQHYESHFERHFLAQSAEFYKIESEKFLVMNSVNYYLMKVERRMHEEMERVKHYLDKSTKNKIVEVLEEEFLKKHMTTLVEMEGSGVYHMLDKNQMKVLARLTNSLGRVPGGHKIIGESLSRFTREKLKPWVMNLTIEAKTCIHNLIWLKDRYYNYLVYGLCNDNYFEKIIAKDFKYLLNLSPRIPEYLAIFIDDRLRRAEKELSDAQVEEALNNAMMLFKHLENKVYYRRHLEKRLLKSKLISEAEKMMIFKLMKNCGYAFTSKMTQMLKDIAISDIVNDMFKSHLTNKNKLVTGVDLTVRVLSSGSWPGLDKPANLNLPKVPSEAFKVFKNFYVNKHSGRDLTLHPRHTCSVNLSARFFKKKRTSLEVTGDPREGSEVKKFILCVSTFQMVILLMFNTRDIITYEEMLTETLIPNRELTKALQSLAVGKRRQRILIKTPSSKEIEPSDEFHVNDTFSSHLHKVKIQQPSAAIEPEPELIETRKKVEEDRKHEIESCIVRIMKSRRQLSHNQLVMEVVEQLNKRFQPCPSIIKLRIEGLIEREFIKRSDNDRNKYIYLA